MIDNHYDLQKTVISRSLITLPDVAKELLATVPREVFTDENFQALRDGIVKVGPAAEGLAQFTGIDLFEISELAEMLPPITLKAAIADLMAFSAEAGAKPALFEKASEFLTENIKIEYLIHKTLAINTLISITGPSGQYKSFVALSLACCIATGRDWYGRAVKPGAVLYLAGEGREGIKLRVTAWMMTNGLTPVDLDAFYLSRNTLMMDGSNIGQIVSEMTGVDVVLLIVDTLARHISGHENDALDMGSFINHVDALKYRLGAAAIIVHHTGHGDQTRGRGSSAFKAALDVEILCDKGVLTFTKMKDAEQPEPIEFKLAQVEIGTDEETGDPITSAVVEFGERSKKNQSTGLTRFEAQAREALITACIAENDLHNGQYSGSLEAWRQEFYRLRRLEDDESKPASLKTAFQRSVGSGNQAGGLKGKGIIAFTERGAHPLRLEDQDRIFNAVLTKGDTRHEGDIVATCSGS
jgi:hypothetical protein